MPKDGIQAKPSPPEAVKQTKIEGKKEGKPVEEQGGGFIVLEHWS